MILQVSTAHPARPPIPKKNIYKITLSVITPHHSLLPVRSAPSDAAAGANGRCRFQLLTSMRISNNSRTLSKSTGSCPVTRRTVKVFVCFFLRKVRGKRAEWRRQEESVVNIQLLWHTCVSRDLPHLGDNSVRAARIRSPGTGARRTGCAPDVLWMAETEAEEPRGGEEGRKRDGGQC